MSGREFWTPVLTHPEVEPWVLHGLASVDDFLSAMQEPRFLEERCEGGGIVYTQKEGYQELHVMFLPEVWGRRASWFLKESIAKKMEEGVTLIAREQEGYWKSRPPRSYGWKQFGDFEVTTRPRRLRKWILTSEAWYRSPVGRKYLNVIHR